MFRKPEDFGDYFVETLAERQPINIRYLKVFADYLDDIFWMFRFHHFFVEISKKNIQTEPTLRFVVVLKLWISRLYIMKTRKIIHARNVNWWKRYISLEKFVRLVFYFTWTNIYFLYFIFLVFTDLVFSLLPIWLIYMHMAHFSFVNYIIDF